MESLGTLFHEAKVDLPKQKVTIEFTRILDATPKVIKILQREHHSLWGHMLWNAGKYLANYFDSFPELCKGKRVIEFGAGLALPSMICHLQGAKSVLCTDYPEDALLNNIREIVESNKCDIRVKGYLWGTEINEKCDLLVLSDLVANHSQHDALIKSILQVLDSENPNAFAICAFSHHRPHLKTKDMEFIEKAKDCLRVEFVETVEMEPMFPDDPGDLLVRSQVHCYKFFRK